MARWVPYLLFLKDFWVTTAQMRSKSPVALSDGPGEREQQLFPFACSGVGTARTVRGHWGFPKAKFQPCPFFSIYDAVHAPLLNTSHQHVTEEPRIRSPESELSHILLGCSTLYPVLKVMVNESSDPASLDGWIPSVHEVRTEAQQWRNCHYNLHPIPELSMFSACLDIVGAKKDFFFYGLYSKH